MKKSKSEGMNWAGNIFHKFEGIIPDVNDIMIQDPFKYVENHVHTVGGSFKKFCSGVVQDFLPVSVDPVKCEAKAVVPEDAVVSPFTYNNDSAVSFVEISSDATVRKSPVVIDGIDLEEKQLGHASGHHNPDQPKNAKSSETHETSDCVLATSKISVLTNGDSGLCDDQNTIKESTGGPMELAFPCATEYFEASSPDELIETNHDNECVVSEIDPIDHAEKQLDHVSAGHHNACQFKTAEAANIYETSGSVLVPVLTNGKSDLTSFVNAIKEAADEPAELTFLGLTESFEASTLDESVETDHENDCVLLPIDAIDHVEKWQIDDDLLSTGHHNADQLRNAKSIYDNESSDSVLAPSMKINALTYINSDLSNVNPIKDSPDGLLELTSPSVSVTEFSDASSFDKLTESNHENECVVSAKFASATSVQSLKIERITGAFCDSFADDAECSFGASSIPSETAPSAVSRDNTITGTGLVSSTSSRLIPSISLPGYSSDILFTGAMFCHNPGDSAGCVSDSPRVLLSSTPDSIMSFKDKALEKQLVSSSSLRSLESTDGSSTDVADSGMETIDLCDEMKLGESCVFVDDSDLYAVSRRAQKLESYKKKIRDIFASKKRLAKEYEQLAIWYGDTDIDVSQDALFDLQSLQARHACDSEWELL